eukprot:9498479-Prorocentrum_lima.AAC.1
MTSSLVGSEMCIRDRNPEHPETFYDEEMALMRQHRWDGQHEQGDWEFQAVSYTHLTLPTICSV